MQDDPNPDDQAATRGYALFATAVGTCGIAWGAAGITGAALPDRDDAALRARMHRRHPGAEESAPPAAVQAVVERIQRLLAAPPDAPADDLADVALDLRCVPEFHRRVYAEARAIAPGQTRTYGEIAARMGEPPQAARRVGQALGANPYPIIVPCHRVLAANGQPGGFSAPGGTRTKLRLLEIEGAALGGGEPGLFD